MKRFLALAFYCLFFLMGCTPKTVISSTYDFDQVQRIGIMSFENRYAALRGVENLFAKYFISSGFKVVERAQLESVLKEHNISVSGRRPAAISSAEVRVFAKLSSWAAVG